eukprot:scaffold18717_cov101-Isochrysis_galbana.AAC.3
MCCGPRTPPAHPRQPSALPSASPPSPPPRSRRRVLLLRRHGPRLPRRLLQGGRGLAAADGLRRARLQPIRGADRQGRDRTDPQALPVVGGAQVHLVVGGQARAEPVPREARPGQVPAQAGHARLQLLPGRLLHLPGLPGLDGGGHAVGAHGGRRDHCARRRAACRGRCKGRRTQARRRQARRGQCRGTSGVSRGCRRIPPLRLGRPHTMGRSAGHRSPTPAGSELRD